MTLKVWFALGAEAVLFAALLFGAAGTLRWTSGWMFLVLFWGCATWITTVLAHRDPALLAERMKPPVQEGQPIGDRVFLAAIGVAFFSWLALMGLDAARFHWSSFPTWLQAVGAAGIVVAFWVIGRVFRENTFLSPVVRVQEERGQTVVTTGPYAVVRHPMYAGALILFLATPLLLGSWWGLAAAILLVLGMTTRIPIEERELRRSLPGYVEYAGRIRYRLIPGVW